MIHQYEPRAESPTGYVPQGPWSRVEMYACWNVTVQTNFATLKAPTCPWQHVLLLVVVLVTLGGTCSLIWAYWGQQAGVLFALPALIGACGILVPGWIAQAGAKSRGVILEYDIQSRSVTLSESRRTVRISDIHSIEQASYWAVKRTAGHTEWLPIADVVIVIREASGLAHICLLRGPRSVARKLGDALGVEFVRSRI